MRDFPIGSIESRAMARMRVEHIQRTKKRIEIISNSRVPCTLDRPVRPTPRLTPSLG